MMDTLPALFLRANAQFPQRTFIRSLRNDGEQRLSYAETAATVARIVEQFQSLAPGDRVICYLEEMVPSILFCLACTYRGAVQVPLSPSFSLEYMKRLMARTGARAVLTGDELAPQLRNHVDVPVYSLSSFASDAGEAAKPELLTALSSQRAPADPYIMLATSGSTGDAKLVLRSYQSQLNDARAVSGRYRPEEEPAQRLLIASPLTHYVGHWILHTAVMLGAELGVPRQLNVACALEDVHTLDPTLLNIVPRVLRSLYHQHMTARASESSESRACSFFAPSANFLVIGGGPVDSELLRYVQAQGLEICESYGSSEAGVNTLTPARGWRPGWVGKPIPGFHLRLAEDGELLVKSPSLMCGYFGDEELTASVLTSDGYYKTGDYAELPDDGYVRILGRKKDIFNTPEGSNIFPARIEALLEGLPWVRQAILIGDQRPFLSALIVVQDCPAGADSDCIPEDQFLALYEQARRDIEQLNASLESIEQVRAFTLLTKPFEPAVYQPLSSGKVHRNRKAVEAVFGLQIASLYGSLNGRSHVATSRI